MAKRDARWPIWKIALTAVGCAGGAVLLFWLSSVANPVETVEDVDEPVPLLTVPTFLIMMGVAFSMLAVLALSWLVYRIYDDRIPPWEKKPRRKRRRRR